MPLTRSSRWDRTVRNAYQMALKIDILQQGEVVHTFEPPNDDAFIIEGQSTFDRADKIRGKGTISFVDGDGSITPKDANDLLAPFGTEWRPWRGVRYPDGTTELKSCGVFRIQNPQIGDTGDGVKIRIEGKDRAETMGLAGFSTNWVIADGTSSDMAVEEIVASTIPNIDFIMAVDDIELPKLTFKQGSDPWEAVLKIAESCGCDAYFDRDGNFVMHKVPNAAQDAINWEFDEDDENVLLNMQRDMQGSTSKDGPWNHIIVQGESVNQQPAVSAEVFDENPLSPTFIETYGRVTKLFTSKLVKTEAQALAMAQGKLNESLGRTETLTFNHIPNPALDVYDVYKVNRRLSKLRDVVAVVDLTTIPLVPIRGQETLSRSRPI